MGITMVIILYAKIVPDWQRGWVLVPPNFHSWLSLCGYVWLYIIIYTNEGEIWRGRVDHGPLMHAKVGSDQLIGVGTGAPKVESLVSWSTLLISSAACGISSVDVDQQLIHHAATRQYIVTDEE